MYRRFGKRLLDLALTIPALILLAPLLALLALLVRLKLDSPVLFRHQRPGLYGRPFTLLKFRTMTDARDAQGNLLPDEQRLPPFGQFMRSTSLDELPELINVLEGEMSLVGPRHAVDTIPRPLYSRTDASSRGQTGYHRLRRRLMAETISHGSGSLPWMYGTLTTNRYGWISKSSS